jgi:hypothetical protein
MHVQLGRLIHFAAWNSFDVLASWWFGLDESKYEWAIYERQAMEEEEFENLATNNMTTLRVKSQLVCKPNVKFINCRPHAFQMMQAVAMEEGQLQTEGPAKLMEMTRNPADSADRPA